MKLDYWSEGYSAGLSGRTYADNPHEGKQGATPWAFGCGEGMRERNRQSLSAIVSGLRACQS